MKKVVLIYCRIENGKFTSHNSEYIRRSAIAPLGLRHIFSKAAGQARLFAFGKTSYTCKPLYATQPNSESSE